MRVRELLHVIGRKYRDRLWLSSGPNETECSSFYEEHSVWFGPLRKMNVPLESLRNKVTTFFREVLERAATRSCWWYAVLLGANNEDSLAQWCGITSIQFETLFAACGFLLSRKVSRDALTNVGGEIRRCDVSEGKPASFKKKRMFLKVGTGATQGVAI
jgi:hypothetical protein